MITAGKTPESKMKDISLSKDAVERQVTDMPEDNRKATQEGSITFTLFALHMDESTDTQNR
jgi:hypothetical protein